MAEYLAHYGRKGMKWGKHIFGSIGDAINPMVSQEEREDTAEYLKSRADQAADDARKFAQDKIDEGKIKALRAGRSMAMRMAGESIKSGNFKSAVEHGKKAFSLSAEIAKTKINRLVGSAGYHIRKAGRSMGDQRLLDRQQKRDRLRSEGYRDTGENIWVRGGRMIKLA